MQTSKSNRTSGPEKPTETPKENDRPKSVPDAIKRGNGRYSFGDSLYLIVRGGSALWEYQFRQDRRLKTMALGSAVARVPGDHPVGVQEARAKRHAAWLARRRGEAPAVGRAGKRFATARDEYLSNHAGEWSPKQAKDHRRRLELHAAALDGRPVNRITVDDVAGVLRPIWTGPNHGRGSKLRGMIELILAAEDVEPNPASWAKLQHKLSKESQETKSYAAIEPDELPSLMAKLATEGSVIARAIRFATLAACRQMEALAATWAEIDFDQRVWTIPAKRMKAGREHVVPLTAEMVACLGMRGADSDFLFPSKRGRHLSYASTGPVLATFGYKDRHGEPITLHGMRSCFADWARSEGFDKLVIDAALAHKLKDKVDRAYFRSEPFEKRRALMAAWCAFVMSSAA